MPNIVQIREKNAYVVTKIYLRLVFLLLLGFSASRDPAEGLFLLFWDVFPVRALTLRSLAFRRLFCGFKFILHIGTS